MEWSEVDIPWLEKDGIVDCLVEKGNILDILEKFDIEYTKSSSGEFTHKLKCPFHSDGSERTASMFVCVDKNSFYCFGCNSGGNIINFVSRILGVPFYGAAEWLLNFIGLDGNIEGNWTRKERRDPQKTVLFQVFEIGKIIREQVKVKEGTETYNKWVVWANDRFKKLDCFLDNTPDEEWETINKYKEKIKDFIERNK